ncbi:Pericentriolar material 1 protein [Actinidia chinensis var. chinensis]|uniref:Pericentriolar material 1 protein n=1 Tax=Actinidia chinensis var. chinensis TaxID=1590841 RepID=A0A2R6PQV8_ACTCC|nr:Pericentriolar material 1 protein [Actinidia chinensis var. chinensis]
MRRPGNYGDSGGNAYAAAQMQHMSGQRMEKSNHYQGRPEPLTSDNERSYGASKADGQWRWERDGSKVPNAMSSHMFNEGQRGDASRSFYQGQRSDPKMALEKQGNNDRRSQPPEEDMDIGYEDPLSQSFEGLEQRFLDDILKLSKEQSDAEDAENTRHRERINTINSQYQEQLAALRARHAGRRDEYLRRESHARQQQFQQAMMDNYPNSGMGTTDPHAYGAVADAAGEPHRAYNADQYDSYRERARFLGGNRDHGFENRGSYPGGRVYDTGSRYY